MLTSTEFFDEDERTEEIAHEIMHLFTNLDIAEPVSADAIAYTVNATLKILERKG